jgi:hypothetical protein
MNDNSEAMSLAVSANLTTNAEMTRLAFPAIRHLHFTVLAFEH